MHPGPVNRGVELSADAIDSPQALIGEQVKAGRGRCGWRCSTSCWPASPALRGGGVMSAEPQTDALHQRAAPAGRAADPRRARARPAQPGSTSRTTSSIRDGRIAELGAAGSLAARPDGEMIDAAGKHAVPGVRRPARAPAHARARSTRRTSTPAPRAAAAGGFCAVIAMPNTDPVVDDAASLRSLLDAAAPRGARAGRLPGRRSRAACSGEELTEMAELRDAGALGFTDDGKPVVSAGMLRKALQYQRLCGGVIALHEEDPALSGDGVMHEGAVSARLGLAGIPSVSRVDDDRARRARSPATRTRACTSSTSPARESVEALAAGQGAPGARVSGEVTPAPPDAHRRGRPHARQPLQDEPAAAHRGRPPGARRGAARAA